MPTLEIELGIWLPPPVTTGADWRVISIFHNVNRLAPDVVEAIFAWLEPNGLSIAKPTSQPLPED